MTVPEKGGRPTLRQLAQAKWRDPQWLHEQLETGISISNLAARAQCTEKTLREWLRKYKLYAPQPPPELGKVYARDARMWEKPDWLRKMRDKGHNVRQIGEMAGVSGQTIATALGGISEWEEPKYLAPGGRLLTEEQVEEEGRVICPKCKRPVIEDEWLNDHNECLYCWEGW